MAIIEVGFNPHAFEKTLIEQTKEHIRNRLAGADINRIKIAMEVGSTVIVLNVSELYESLYDALNQYYTYIKEERYVDLG